MEYEKRAWGLESGMFFDGHFYRNVYGDILTQGHPSMFFLCVKKYRETRDLSGVY